VYRAASFIWTPRRTGRARDPLDALFDGARPEAPESRWIVFRCVVKLPAPPERSRLRVGVDAPYQLFANGECVGRGPTLAGADCMWHDAYDLGACLRQGRNAIALLVFDPGSPVDSSSEIWRRAFERGGLYVDGEISCGKEQVAVRSNARWRCLEWSASGEQPVEAPVGPDSLELHDATRMPQQWSTPEFDDRKWDRAEELVVGGGAPGAELGGIRIEPFAKLVEREVAHPGEFTLVPDTVIRVDGLRPREDLPLNRRIFEEALVPPPDGLVIDPEALRYSEGCPTTVRTLKGLDVSLLVDFGCIHPGYPFLELEARGGEVFELAVSESLPGEWSAQSPNSLRLKPPGMMGRRLFRYVARPGRQRFEALERTSFRYLQLVVREAPGSVQILRLGSTATLYGFESRGRFECSDPKLNQLWELSRDTLEAHLPWLDCPSRDPAPWPGAAVVQFLAGQAAFGPHVNGLSRQLLLHSAETQRPDGLCESPVPGRRNARIPTPDGTLQWILNADLHYQYTGDLETIEAIFPAAQRALSWFEGQIGPNGLVCDVPYWQFLDWAAVGRRGEGAVLNALYVGALRAAERLAVALQNDRAANRCSRLLQQVSAGLNLRHWDANRGVYVDEVDPASGEQNLRVSQHANAAMIFFDVAPRDRWPSMIARIGDAKRLVSTAAPPAVPSGQDLDPENGVVAANAFFSHYVLAALARAGRADLALDAIRAGWLPMIERGARTLWECFEPTAGLCHAVSAAPLFHLSSRVLGVAPLEVGFSRIRIAPQPAHLEWAEGTFPTVRGDVYVGWRRDEGGLDLSFRLPPGAKATIVGPPEYDRMQQAETRTEGTYQVRLLRRRPEEPGSRRGRRWLPALRRRRGKGGGR
jgi:hypothetical protein